MIKLLYTWYLAFSKSYLKAERIKNRFNLKHQNILTSTLKEAANQLFNNPDIIIHTGDKTNIYIILNKTDYNKKRPQRPNKILKNSPKTPLTNLNNTLTKLSANNAEIGSIKLTKITGDYKPGYIYIW